MRNEDSESDSAALRLRCIRVIADLDDEGLQVVGALLDRVAPSEAKPRKRAARGERARNAAGDKESAT
jgi:hypothetical protein